MLVFHVGNKLPKLQPDKMPKNGTNKQHMLVLATTVSERPLLRALKFFSATKKAISYGIITAFTLKSLSATPSLKITIATPCLKIPNLKFDLHQFHCISSHGQIQDLKRRVSFYATSKIAATFIKSP